MRSRIKKCAELIKAHNYDSFLVSNPINIRYLTGFYPNEGYLLITSEQELFYFTNFLYRDAAKKINPVTKSSSNRVKFWELIVSTHTRNIFNLLVRKIKELKLKRIAFEGESLSFLEYKTITKLLSNSKAEFLETKDFIEKIRMIKNKDEISLIRKSVQISKEAFEFVEEIFDGEMSEKDLSIEVEKFLRLKGDNEIAFSSIVASGKNTCLPHHWPRDEKIGKNFFLIDLGSKYYGYCADLTRVFFWSKMPLLFKKIYDTVQKAKELSIKKIKEGIKAKEVDKVAREFIEKKGWGKYFGHGVGHGIGLCVHEPPQLGPKSEAILKEGMVVTVEPAIYFGKRFGVRIEDMVLVKQGSSEVL